MYLIENETLALRCYSHDDDYDMYLCWKDIETQKGYNGIFAETLDAYCAAIDIEKFKFWVTVIDKSKNVCIGTLRLGLDEKCPDLAIWIYPQYRNKGYGTASYKLALRYLFDHFNYKEISAGCYQGNVCSIRMLEKVGFTRYQTCDSVETNCFTGNKIVQQEYRLLKEFFVAD